MANSREKDNHQKKQVNMTLDIISGNLDRVVNCASSLSSLADSLTKEVSIIKALIEALKSQIEDIEE